MRVESAAAVSDYSVRAVQPVSAGNGVGSAGEIKIEERAKDLRDERQPAGQNGEIGRLSEQEVISSIQEANKKLQRHDTRLEFSIHEKTKEIMVKVVDAKTQEVIKEIPPEKILDMVAKLLELAGILVDERA